MGFSLVATDNASCLDAQCFFFQGLQGGKFPPQTVTDFVHFWMFFTFSLPTKAVFPPNYISRKKNPVDASWLSINTGTADFP